MSREYYIGCISGTSLDGLDLALVDFDENTTRVLSTHCQPIPDELSSALSELCLPGPDEIDRLGEADVALGKFISSAINNFVKQTGIEAENIAAIGSHGQTIRHRPNALHPFTMQLGNGHVIAEQTGIMTIADFRMADMAAGGHGAPLVPAFHSAIFSSDLNQRLVINLGGISNISIIPASNKQDTPASGYDIGPANTLMDRWIERHKGLSYDKDGAWANEGIVEVELLKHMLCDPFFATSGPKSTGREYFNLSWLNKFQPEHYAIENVQRTLLELCAITVANAIKHERTSRESDIFVCGGGAHNTLLMQRIAKHAEHDKINTTDALGISVDDVEACAFAWLARQTIKRRPGNLCSVTGANKAKILGAIYLP